MGEGRYLRRSHRQRRLRLRRLRWIGELAVGSCLLGALWALGYIHPVPAGAMMALLSGRQGYLLGRYR